MSKMTVYALIGLLSLCASSLAFAQSSKWQKAARAETMRWIKKSVVKLDRDSRKEGMGGISLYEEGMIFKFSDIDNDGDEDAITEYSTEGMGSGSGTQYLVIFRNDDGKPRFARQIELWSLGTQITSNNADGGYGEPRYFTLISVDNNLLTLDGLFSTEEDGQCCPSMKGTFSFEYDGKQLLFNKVVTVVHRSED